VAIGDTKRFGSFRHGEQQSGVAVVHQQRSTNSEQSTAKSVGVLRWGLSLAARRIVEAFAGILWAMGQWIRPAFAAAD